MRHHHDEFFLRDLLQQLHNLFARLAVQRSRGLVGEDDVGVVDDGARDGDPLHLSARKLRGFLFRLVGKPHAFQRGKGFCFAFLGRKTRNRHTHLDVALYGEMRDEVVGLKDEADAVIAVDVPVVVGIVLCADPVHEDVAACITVKPADDVEQGGFTAAGRPQNRHKFAFSETQIHAFQDVHDVFFGNVIFYYFS